MGHFGRVRLKIFELIILKILLQSSIFLLHSVPKSYTSILDTVKNLDKTTFKPPSSKKLIFVCGPTPSSAKFAMETFKRFDWHYSVKQWLTLGESYYCIEFAPKWLKICTHSLEFKTKPLFKLFFPALSCFCLHGCTCLLLTCLFTYLLCLSFMHAV